MYHTRAPPVIHFLLPAAGFDNPNRFPSPSHPSRIHPPAASEGVCNLIQLVGCHPDRRADREHCEFAGRRGPAVPARTRRRPYPRGLDRRAGRTSVVRGVAGEQRERFLDGAAGHLVDAVDGVGVPRIDREREIRVARGNDDTAIRNVRCRGTQVLARRGQDLAHVPTSKATHRGFVIRATLAFSGHSLHTFFAPGSDR